MLIEITYEDIKLGRPFEPSFCPLARAIKRATQREDISLGSTFLDIGADSFHLTKKAERFVRDFDTGAPVTPCKLRIHIPKIRVY